MRLWMMAARRSCSSSRSVLLRAGFMSVLVLAAFSSALAWVSVRASESAARALALAEGNSLNLVMVVLLDEFCFTRQRWFASGKWCFEV